MTKRSLSVFALALLLTAWTSVASAQSTQPVTGGIMAGINSATVSGTIDSDVTKGRRTGGVFGAFMSVPLRGMWSFQPEFLYSMEGATGTLGSNKSTVKLDMFRVPLLARFGPPPGPYASCCYIVAGPSLGFVTRARQTGTSGADDDIKDTLRSTELALVGGVGMVISRFNVEARYTGGLTDLNKDGMDSEEKNKTRMFSVMVGVKF